jgi:hypothetical protein
MAIKRRNYTLALNNLKQCDEIIWKLQNHYAEKYAYILHDKDVKDDGTGVLKDDHYHFYIEFKNPRSLNSVAEDLTVPANMVCQVYSKKGILQYLTHQNQPEKYQYNPDEVVSNFDIGQEFADDMVKLDQLWADYKALRFGRMDYDEFYMRHKTDLLRHLR